MNVPKLEDFGIKVVPTPQERLATYKAQCRGMPKLKKARFWLGVLDSDPEVSELCKANGTPRKRGRRSSKGGNVPNSEEVRQNDENGVSQ